MSFFEFMDLASSLVRLSFLIAAPIFASISLLAWINGRREKAIYLLCWSIFLGMTR